MDITALAASPISENQPAGADAKYEPGGDSEAFFGQSERADFMAGRRGQRGRHTRAKVEGHLRRGLHGGRARAHRRRSGIPRRREPAARRLH